MRKSIMKRIAYNLWDRPMRKSGMRWRTWMVNRQEKSMEDFMGRFKRSDEQTRDLSRFSYEIGFWEGVLASLEYGRKRK